MKPSTDHRGDRIICCRGLYDLKAAAEYLGRPVSGVRNLIYSGHLPVIQHGERGKQFVDVRDLEEYVERHKRRLT